MAKNSSSKTGSSPYGDSSGSSSYDSNSRGSGIGDRVSELGETAAAQIDNNPIIAVGAGLALGAVLGAMLPASRKERELLAPVGSKVTDAGYGVVDRAREMGKQKFDEMAGDKVREFFGVSGSSSDSSNS